MSMRQRKEIQKLPPCSGIILEDPPESFVDLARFESFVASETRQEHGRSQLPAKGAALTSPLSAPGRLPKRRPDRTHAPIPASQPEKIRHRRALMIGHRGARLHMTPTRHRLP
jgi:hypothetical protein